MVLKQARASLKEPSRPHTPASLDARTAMSLDGAVSRAERYDAKRDKRVDRVPAGAKSRKNQQAKSWSNWRTFNSNYKNILDGDQYVQVQVALNADASMRTKNREYQEIKSVEVRSECH